MTNGMILLLLACAAAWGAWRTARRLRRGGGCCGEHEAAPARTAVADRNRAHYPWELTLNIGGMTCENCARRVENALNALEGTWAVVDIGSRTARVRCKQAPDTAALAEAVRRAGYVVLPNR